MDNGNGIQPQSLLEAIESLSNKVDMRHDELILLLIENRATFERKIDALSARVGALEGRALEGL